MPLEYEDYAGRVEDKSKLDLQLDQTNAGVDKHLTDIASGLIDLDILTAKLELKHAILKDVEKNYPHDVSRQRTELLRGWKKEFGTKATYARLLRVCVETSNADSAETIVRLLNQKSVSENSETVTSFENLKPSKCQFHRENLKNVYCTDCGCLICSECTQSAELHCGHEYRFTQEMKSSLKSKLAPLKKNLTHCIERIKIAESSIVRQSSSVKSQIESTFEDLEKIIKARKQELLEEATLKESKKLNKLSLQKEEVSKALQSILKSIEKCHSADEIFMRNYADIKSLLKTEGKYLETKNLGPVVVADMGAELNCRDDLIHLCQNNTKLTQLQVECTVSGKGLQSSEVDATSEFEISDIRLSNGKPLKQSQGVQCHLKRLACSTITECHVKNTKDGVYQVQYTPTLRGHHELTVTVTEQEVQGSPFPVFVSIPLTQPGKIVKTFFTDSSAIDVAVTSSNRIVVATIDKLLLLDSEGKCLNSFSRLADDKYMGVAVDRNDNVYAVVFKKKTYLVSYVITHRRKDSTKFCVLKLNSNLSSVLQECEFEDIEGYWFSGISVVRDEVMVCCHKTNTVKVFSKKLIFMREIDCWIRNICDICSDDEGKLYVSDVSGLVHVSKNGVFLQSLPADEPCGICTAGDLIYITSYTGMVHVWRLGVLYLGLFGQKGASQGEFQDINGVAVDEDGFVYVCDSKGVQKF